MAVTFLDTTPQLSGPSTGREQLYIVLGVSVLTRKGPSKEHFGIGNMRFGMRFLAEPHEMAGETWLRLCEQYAPPPLWSTSAMGLMVTGTDELWTKLDDPLVRKAEGETYSAGEVAEVVHGPGPSFGTWSPIRVVGHGQNPGTYRIRPLDAAEGDESRDVENVPVWFLRKVKVRQPAPAPPGAEEDSSPDLALGRPAKASTEKSGERAASNAVDGKSSTRWTSLYEDNQWLSVDLGSETLLRRVDVRWEAAFAASYLVQGSSDGKSWFTLASERGRDGWVVTRCPEGSTARWLRIFGQKRATQYGFSIWELRAFGASAAAEEAAATQDEGAEDELDLSAVWAAG